MTPMLLVPGLLLSCQPVPGQGPSDPLTGAWQGMALPCDADDVAGALSGSGLEVTAGPYEEVCGPDGWHFQGLFEPRLDTCFFEVVGDVPLVGFDDAPPPDPGGSARVFVGEPGATVERATFQFYPADMLLHGVIEYDLDGFTNDNSGRVAPCEHFSLAEDPTPGTTDAH